MFVKHNISVKPFILQVQKEKNRLMISWMS